MKQKILTIILAGFCLIFAGCQVRYDGSRMGNDSYLVMEYRIFEGSDEQPLSLQKGDVLKGTIHNSRGTVWVELYQQGKEEPVFELQNPPRNLEFTINVEEDGEYILRVYGRNARGSLSVVKQEIGSD